MGNSLDPVEKLGLGIHRANYQGCRNSSSYLHRRQERSNRLLGKKLLPVTENALDQRYPTTVVISGALLNAVIPVVSYLHRYQAVINQDLLCQKVGTNSGFVTCTKLFIDLSPYLSARIHG